jgi:hypothetical protein
MAERYFVRGAGLCREAGSRGMQGESGRARLKRNNRLQELFVWS